MKVKMQKIIYQGEFISLTAQINNRSHQKNYSYAYYIYQDDHISQRFWYQPCQRNIKIQFKLIYSGTYKIRLFIKEDNIIIFNEITSELAIDIHKKIVVETTLANEKVFFSDVPVKYIFEQTKEDINKLVISFAGLYSTEFQGGAPVYNHMRTLEPVKAHKLFILDSYRSQFCYYVGLGGRYDFERSVMALIAMIIGRYQISSKDIIATGSSKGGAAALYYSLKYHFGKAVIGAPQVFIANYLESRASSPSMRLRLNRLIGEDKQYGKVFWNHLILNQVAQTDDFPEMHFHVGKGDFHYSEHLKPLFKIFAERNVYYKLDLADYDLHSDTGLYFTPFLLQTVQGFLARKEEES